MNKKFSTLLLGALLAGAFTANAERVATQAEFEALIKNGVLELPAGDLELVFVGDEDFKVNYYQFNSGMRGGGEYLVVNTPNVTIKGEDGAQLTGRLVLAAENIKVSGLTIINNGLGESGTANDNSSTFWNKSAISVLADAVTITNNVIKAGDNTKQLLYGIELIPKSDKVKYSISTNTFDGFGNSITTQNKGITDFSYAVSMDLNYDIDDYRAGFVPGIEAYTSPSSTNFDLSTLEANGNTFEGCIFNYATILNPDGKWVDPENNPLKYKVAQVEPLYEDGKLTNANAIQDVVENAGDNATIIFNGSAKQLQKALGDDFETAANVAIQCNDANALYGTATNPDNGRDPVILDVEELGAVLGQNVLAENNGTYNLLVVNDGGTYYAIYANEDGTFGRTEATNRSILTDEAYLWLMTENKDPQGNIYYSFVNQKEVPLVNGRGDVNQQKGMFYPANGVAYNAGVAFELSRRSFGIRDFQAGKYNFGLYKAGMNPLYVSNLNWFEEDGFSVTITCDKNETGDWDNDALVGSDVFSGHLTPMTWTGSKFEVAGDNETIFALKNADGDYIVAEQYASSGSDALQRTYTFKTVSEEALIHDINDANAQKYSYYFSAEVSATYTNLQELEVIDNMYVWIDDAPATIGRLDLTSAQTPTLVASHATSLKEIRIALGNGQVVDKTKFLQRGKFYTIEKITKDAKDNGTLAVNGDDENSYWATFVKSYGNVLEAQWALTVQTRGEGENAREYYVFTNREATNEEWTMLTSNLYYGGEDKTYSYNGDTYKIDTVAVHSASDGYRTLEDVKNNKFYLGYSSDVFEGNAWFVENHSGDENHVIGLSSDQEEALVFTATEYANPRKVEHNDHVDVYTPSDSIYVISTLGYYDDKGVQKYDKDTLKIVSYTFVNQYNEPLRYGNSDRYESVVYKDAAEKERFENVADAQTVADHFAIRIDGSKWNLRLADTYDVADRHKAFNNVSKVYAGDTDNGMLAITWLYNRRENDLFVVEPTEKPMYRTVINPLDTISIFRDDNSQSVLFEHNTFLGMENLSQYPEIAKAMIADTAYVRNNTYRPQYMLVVGADITPAGKWCPIHGDDPTCPDAHKVETSGWVEGRYLVNLVDTAIAWDAANKHKDNNPYINSEKYYRLGFVQAKHINDSLVIASTNDTLYVGSEDYNQAKFAFRYVDQEAGSFVIETANYKQLPGVEEAEIDEDAPLGYLKWMNGVVVVVDDINNADVYNMNENETDTPTANEDIAVEEGVEVIAGNGSVTIQGAAGKTVVITNILGKAVANTTLTSDNQTINVPAGIVVVTVDGEAVKAIVK